MVRYGLLVMGAEYTNYTSPMSHSWGSLTGRLVLRGLMNPRLGIDLLRTAWAFRRRGWWAQPPFLPVPDRTYLRWRMYTAYADEDAVPPLDDVICFARWRGETMGLCPRRTWLFWVEGSPVCMPRAVCGVPRFA